MRTPGDRTNPRVPIFHFAWEESFSGDLSYLGGPRDSGFEVWFQDLKEPCHIRGSNEGLWIGPLSKFHVARLQYNY